MEARSDLGVDDTDDKDTKGVGAELKVSGLALPGPEAAVNGNDAGVEVGEVGAKAGGLDVIGEVGAK